MNIRRRWLAGLAALAWAGTALADIHHLVIFKYQPGVAAEKKAEIARRFVALKDLARQGGKPYIVSIAAGRGVSREGFDRGLEEAFVVRFKNEADRNFFVGKPYAEAMDPAHLAVAQVVEPLLEKSADGQPTGLFVFDFDDQDLAKR